MAVQGSGRNAGLLPAEVPTVRHSPCLPILSGVPLQAQQEAGAGLAIHRALEFRL